MQHICSALAVRGCTLMARSLPQACFTGREQRGETLSPSALAAVSSASICQCWPPLLAALLFAGPPERCRIVPWTAKGGTFTWSMGAIAAETGLCAWCGGGCPALTSQCVCAVSVPPHRLFRTLQDPSCTPGTKDSSPSACRQSGSSESGRDCSQLPRQGRHKGSHSQQLQQ